MPSPSGSEDSECSVVIKQETEYEEYASLSVSQQQERLILFLSMITTFLTVNSRFVAFCVSFYCFVGTKMSCRDKSKIGTFNSE